VTRALHLGDFHPQLEAAFVARLRRLAPQGDARGVLLVVANRLLGAHLRRRAAELGVATLGLRPRALEDLIDELAQPRIAAAGERRLPRWQEPLLVAEVVRPTLRRRPDSYFAGAARQAGLYRVLAGTLRDLRDAGVSPDELEEALARAASAPAADPELAGAKLSEVADIHRRYAAALAQRRLVDDAGAAELAAAVLEEGALAGRPLLLYGLYDLVGRQRRVVGALLAGDRPADVFLPWGEPEEAFAYARPLRDWLESRGLRPTPPEALPGAPAPAGGLGRLRARLFAPDREDAAPAAGSPASPADSSPSVRLVSAPDPEREVREVVRCVAGERAGGGLVLLRHGEQQAPGYRSLARLAGVALHLPAGEPWRRRGEGRALELLLALADDRRHDALSRSTVEDLLATGVLHPDRFPAGSRPGRWTQALRSQGVAQELAGWRRLTEAWSGAGSQPGLPFAPPAGAAPAAGAGADEEEERDPALRRELPFVAEWIRDLLADLERLGESARSFAAFTRRLREVARRWLRPGPASEELVAALQPLAELDGVIACSWPAAREAAAELLGTSAARAGDVAADAPTVADLLAARGVTAERVVVPGLVERQFPRRARPDPVLLDEERRRLNLELVPERALRLAAASWREERLLFRLAVGAARRELVLTWPRSGDEGRPLVPSAFLLEAARALAGREVGFEELRDAGGELGVERIGLSPLLSPPGPPGAASRRPLLASEHDLERIAAARRAGDARGLGYLLAAHPRFAAAAAMEIERHGFERGARLGAFDGVVGEELGGAWLAGRRRDDGAVALSPSALEAYAQCSFHFFHREVLRLRSQPAPERRLDLEQREVGLLYHHLLRALFERLQQEGLLPLGEERLERATRLVGPTLDALLARRPRLAGEGPQPLWLARRRRLESDVAALLAAQAREPAGWTPRRHELVLGEGGGEPRVRLGSSTLAVRGRLDRVDAGPPGLRIVDYKTGRLKRPLYGDAGDVQGGRRLQLPLYRLALRELEGGAAGGAPPIHGLFLGVEAASGYRQIPWTPADFERATPELDAVVGAMLDGIAAGEFFQVERGVFCERYCPYGEICGPGRESLIARKAADPRAARAAAWRRLEPPVPGGGAGRQA
jgi:hypothetical protein